MAVALWLWSIAPSTRQMDDAYSNNAAISTIGAELVQNSAPPDFDKSDGMRLAGQKPA